MAVDAEKRMPLRLTVLAAGSTRPGPAGRLHRAELRPTGPSAVHLHAAARRDGDGRPGARAQQAAPSAPPSVTAGTLSSIMRPADTPGDDDHAEPAAPDLSSDRQAGERAVGQRTADHHRGRDGDHHRRRAGRRRRRARAGAHRGARPVIGYRADRPRGRGRPPDGGRRPRSGRGCARSSGRRSRWTDVDLDVPDGAVLGMLGPERLGQDHADPAAARPHQPTAGSVELLGDADARRRGDGAAARRRLVEGPGSIRSCPAGRTCGGSRPPSRCSPPGDPGRGGRRAGAGRAGQAANRGTAATRSG